MILVYNNPSDAVVVYAYLMELTEFLTARLDEDEARALDTRDPPYRHIVHLRTQTLEDRFLAEVEAKRQIMEMEANVDSEYLSGFWDAHDRTLQALALIYADHPDYREEWRVR